MHYYEKTEAINWKYVTLASLASSKSLAPNYRTMWRRAGTERLSSSWATSTEKRSIFGPLGALWEKSRMAMPCSPVSQKLTNFSAFRRSLASWHRTSKSFLIRIRGSWACSSHPSPSQRRLKEGIWARWHLRPFSASKECWHWTQSNASQPSTPWQSPGSTKCVSQRSRS